MFNDQDRRDIRQGNTLITKYWLYWVTAITGVGLFAAYYVQPLFVKAETRAIRQSNQYLTSTETMLVDKMQQWQDLDNKANEYDRDPANSKIVSGFRAQQATLIRQMKAEANRVGHDQVPADVRDFLASR